MLILTCPILRTYLVRLWAESNITRHNMRDFSVDPDSPILRIFPVWCDCGQNQIECNATWAAFSVDSDSPHTQDQPYLVWLHMGRIKYHVTQYEPPLMLILTRLCSGPIWCDCGHSQIQRDTMRAAFSVDSDLPHTPDLSGVTVGRVKCHLIQYDRVTFNVDPDLPVLRIFPVWCDCGHNQISRETIRATFSVDPDLPVSRIFPTLVLILTCLCPGSSLI